MGRSRCPRAAGFLFRRELIRLAVSISALITAVPPNATIDSSQGWSWKALPPRRPMKKAYDAQSTAATAVAAVNLQAVVADDPAGQRHCGPAARK